MTTATWWLPRLMSVDKLVDDHFGIFSYDKHLFYMAIQNKEKERERERARESVRDVIYSTVTQQK